MENKIKCLDHGFVKLLNISSAVPRELETSIDKKDAYEFTSRDIDPAICARISFDNFDKERTEEQDLHLVEYLMANKHNTPIEMTEIWLEMKLPIFVARQFVRHRTACLNEVSGRYVTLPEEYYIPEVVGGKSTSGAKQGQENNLSIIEQDRFKETLKLLCEESYNLYLGYIRDGVAPEHARMFLHVNHYTHWVWKQDLHNLMHFLSLRLHEHAQIEARCYANAIYTLLAIHLPETMKLFDKYRRM
jgi:thymidylate synthase (FAD)